MMLEKERNFEGSANICPESEPILSNWLNERLKN